MQQIEFLNVASLVGDLCWFFPLPSTLTKISIYLKVRGKEIRRMSGDISLISPDILIQFCIRSLPYWLRDALTHLCIKWLILAHLYTDHFCIVSPLYWLTSTGSPLYWYASVLVLIYIGSPLYRLSSIESPLCCPTSVMSGLATDSLLYWLNSILAHFYSVSPPVLADFWKERKPYVCRVISVLDHLYTNPVLYSLTSVLAQRCTDSPLY